MTTRLPDAVVSSGRSGRGAWHPFRSVAAVRSSRNPHPPSTISIDDRYRQSPSKIERTPTPRASMFNRISYGPKWPIIQIAQPNGLGKAQLMIKGLKGRPFGGFVAARGIDRKSIKLDHGDAAFSWVRTDVSPNIRLGMPAMRAGADLRTGGTGEISEDWQRLGRFRKQVTHELRGLLIRDRCSA